MAAGKQKVRDLVENSVRTEDGSINKRALNVGLV